MDSKVDVLLACPFCGAEAAVNTCRTSEREYIRLNKRDTGYGVNCISCGVNNRGIAIGYATAQEAIAAWNRRDAADKGPWTRYGDWSLQSDDFNHDVMLGISGDFADDEDRDRYIGWLLAKLNARITADNTPIART